MSILGALGTLLKTAIPSIIKAGINWFKNLGETPQVKPDTPVQTIEDIGEALSGLRETILREIQPSMKNADDEITEYIADQFTMFEDNAEVIERNQISIHDAKARLNEIPRRAKEFWENQIRRKISLDNPDCRAILKLPSGAKKESDTQKFIEDVLRESLESYAEYFQKSITGIYDGIMSDAKRSVARAESKAKEYSDLVDAVNSGDDEKFESMISRAQLKIFVCEKLIEKARE